MAKKNNYDNVELGELIRREMREVLGEFDERLEQLEDRARGDGQKKSEAAVVIANKFFAANKDEILEASRISGAAVDPICMALSLDSMMDPEVQSGKMSLARKSIDYFFRVVLSRGGWNRELGMEALTGQLGQIAQESEEAAARHEMGG